jgi:hypothetical protein
MSRTRFVQIVGVCATAGILALGLPGAAAATTTDDPVSFTFADSSQTVEYGEGWYFEFQCPDCFEDAQTVTSPDFPSGYKVELDEGYGYGDDELGGTIYPRYDKAPLAVGDYAITIKQDETSDDGTEHWYGSETVNLSIVPAKLTAEVQALPDNLNSQGVIVSATLNGKLADGYGQYNYQNQPVPDGNWKISIVDEAGTTVLQTTVFSKDSATPFDTQIYWATAVADVDYTVTATYSMSGSGSQNFEIVPASAAYITGAGNPRVSPSSTAGPPPQAQVVEPPIGPAVPFIVIVLIAIAIAGLATLVTIFTVRIVRAKGLAATDDAL